MRDALPNGDTGLTDPAPYISVIVALSASVTAGLAYRRGRRADDKTSDLDTLREIVHTLQEENTDQRARLTQISARLDDCTREKTEQDRKIFDLQGQVYRLKAATNG